MFNVINLLKIMIKNQPIKTIAETKKFETFKPKRVTTFLPLSASLRLNFFMLSIFLIVTYK